METVRALGATCLQGRQEARPGPIHHHTMSLPPAKGVQVRPGQCGQWESFPESSVRVGGGEPIMFMGQGSESMFMLGFGLTSLDFLPTICALGRVEGGVSASTWAVSPLLFPQGPRGSPGFPGPQGPAGQDVSTGKGPGLGHGSWGSPPT